MTVLRGTSVETSLAVSVCCVTYNQERYIARALDSFLDQRTSRAYEIIVHDDASTDGTADVILSYAERYPSLIRPVLASENQYSKGEDVFSLAWRHARGSYIALCEGDDYWTDPQKLQRQVDRMEESPDISLSVHAGSAVTEGGEYLRTISCGPANCTISFEQVVLGGGNQFPTASMMFRRDALECLPDYYWRCPIGDYPLSLYLASIGSVDYLAAEMSAYRTSARNSYTVRVENGFDRARAAAHHLAVEELLRAVDIHTRGKYTACLELKARDHEVRRAALERDYARMRGHKLRDAYNALSRPRKALIQLGRIHPLLESAASSAVRLGGRQIGKLNRTIRSRLGPQWRGSRDFRAR